MAEECTWSMATFAGFILSLFGSKIKATSLHFPTKIEIDAIQGVWCQSWFYKSLGSHPFLRSCHLIRLCKFCDTRLVCLAGLFSCITNNSARPCLSGTTRKEAFPMQFFSGVFFCKACVYRVQWTLAARRPVWGNVMNSLILWVVSNLHGLVVLHTCTPSHFFTNSTKFLSFDGFKLQGAQN